MRDVRRCWLVAGMMLVGLLALIIGAQASSVDYGDVNLDGGSQAGHFGEAWDLTKGDMYVIVTVDLTGMVDTFGGAAHAWAALGIRQLGYGDFNPTWMAGGAGVWLATDYDWSVDTFAPDPPGAPIQDMDDKLILQRGGGMDESYYDLPSSPPNPWANSGMWFDRDGVDPWQAGMWGAIDGVTYNTGGTYDIVFRLHADSPTSGTAYMMINGLDQGFYVPNWHAGPPDLTPAGMTFTGDMTQMQVFYGIYGYGATHSVQFGDLVAILTDVVWVDDDWGGNSKGDKVDGHYYGYDAFSTVQAGVDGVGNSTVHIGDGAYVEQIEIFKDLTLDGNGASTIIESPDDLTKKFTTSKDNYPIIYVHDTDNVTVQNLVVDGAGRGNANYRFVGIGYHNAGGTIDNVEVKDVRDTPFSGSQHGVGIYAYNDDGTARTLVVTNCTIYDFQKNAMALMGDGLTVNVTGNTVVGAGPTGVTAQNGIQVTNGAGGTISGNSVEGVWYTGPSWTASGMLLGGTDGNLTVQGNDILDSQTNLYAFDTAGNLLIERNVIKDGNWNLILYNTPGTELFYNSITGSGDGCWTDSNPDATLNWWGSTDGPTGDWDDDGTVDYAGGGEVLYGDFIFSPWLGSDPDGDPNTPGVQLSAPLYIIVDDVGPAPAAGYLNTAIAAANSPDLPGTDTIEVRHGAYNDSPVITKPVNIISETGSASHTTLNGNMTLGSSGILIGQPLQGFTIKGNMTVQALIDASTIHINWNDLYNNNVTNNGTGTLDAQYNFWGTQENTVIDGRTTGAIDFDPFLPKNADGSYNDIQAMLDAGLVPGLNAAIDHLWTMMGLGLDVNTYIQYQPLMGAGALAGMGGPGASMGAGAGGTILNNEIMGGGGAFLGVSIDAIYTQGETIDGTFVLTDPLTGDPITDAVVTLSVVQVNDDGSTSLVHWGMITYDEGTGEYVFNFDTSGLAPGIYDLLIQTDDGQSFQLRVEVTGP